MLGIQAWSVQTVPVRWSPGPGVPLADAYLEFLGGRCRPNTVRAAAYDLKVFFAVVGKAPDRVRPADVLAFITAQRTGQAAGRGALQPVTTRGEPGGVSAATVRRRLSIVSGFFAFLQARGDVAANPVPRGLPTRRERSRPGQGVPLVRAVRQLPRVLTPAQVDALMAALRTHRDRAMVAAMVLGGPLRPRLRAPARKPRGHGSEGHDRPLMTQRLAAQAPTPD
jgi:integrase/recombinase XerD